MTFTFCRPLLSLICDGGDSSDDDDDKDDDGGGSNDNDDALEMTDSAFTAALLEIPLPPAIPDFLLVVITLAMTSFFLRW